MLTEDDKDDVICQALTFAHGVIALCQSFIEQLRAKYQSIAAEVWDRDYRAYVPRLVKLADDGHGDPKVITFSIHVITSLTALVENHEYDEAKRRLVDVWIPAINRYAEGDADALE